MSDQEKILMYKTSNILKKDTSMMKLNDIIDELVRVIESRTKDEWLDSKRIMEKGRGYFLPFLSSLNFSIFIYLLVDFYNLLTWDLLTPIKMYYINFFCFFIKSFAVLFMYKLHQNPEYLIEYKTMICGKIPIWIMWTGSIAVYSK